jgi:hypothetical protein
MKEHLVDVPEPLTTDLRLSYLVTYAIVGITSSGQVGDPNRYGLVIIGQI